MSVRLEVSGGTWSVWLWRPGITPARLLLGSDAVWLAPQIAAARAAEDAAWRDLSLSTDHDGLPDFAATEVARLVRPDQP